MMYADGVVTGVPLSAYSDNVSVRLGTPGGGSPSGSPQAAASANATKSKEKVRMEVWRTYRACFEWVNP